MTKRETVESFCDATASKYFATLLSLSLPSYTHLISERLENTLSDLHDGFEIRLSAAVVSLGIASELFRSLSFRTLL